jgi:hypothetical protein
VAIVIDDGARHEAGATDSSIGWIAAGGIASLGAGAIHAAAIGVHAEHRQAAIAFIVVAAVQLIAGAVALLRTGKLVILLGTAVSAVAIGGWVLAKSSGIAFIDGLETVEPVQLADGMAAGLAAAGLVLMLIASMASETTSPRWSLRVPMSTIAIGVLSLTVYGMTAAGTHVHDESSAAAAADSPSAPTADLAGVVAPVTTAEQTADTTVVESTTTSTTAPAAAITETTVTETTAHSHDPASVAPVAYDPNLPIDLGGVPGVTPEQQAAAENIISVTLLRLPQWADPAVAEAAGFRSIGDGATGVEHLVNEVNMSDAETLDPDYPESLVYDTTGGGRRLVAAMYMVKRGTPLEDVPNMGGALMQWHTHDNLCYNAQGHVAGLTDAQGNCAPGLIKPVETPMIHVWIEPNPCGPFAALEGIGGGRIPDGEARLCDTAHGSHG